VEPAPKTLSVEQVDELPTIVYEPASADNIVDDDESMEDTGVVTSQEEAPPASEEVAVAPAEPHNDGSSRLPLHISQLQGRPVSGIHSGELSTTTTADPAAEHADCAQSPQKDLSVLPFSNDNASMQLGKPPGSAVAGSSTTLSSQGSPTIESTDLQLTTSVESADVRLTASATQYVRTTCTVCSICIDDFVRGESLTMLPRCQHAFHKDCILPWLTERSASCPLCKTNVLESDDVTNLEINEDDSHASDTSSDLEGHTDITSVPVGSPSRTENDETARSSQD
jgi:Ring finger domain